MIHRICFLPEHQSESGFRASFLLVAAGLIAISTSPVAAEKKLEPIPDKLVVLTFDDSVKSHYTVARPILKQYGFGATFFITEGFTFKTNKTDYMTWEEIQALDRDGFEIGNHTGSHMSVTAKTLDQLDAQLNVIANRCQEMGIAKPTSFAWPGNSLDLNALPILRMHGIRFARRGGAPEYPYDKGKGFAYEPGQDDPLLIPSAGDARPNWQLSNFVAAVEQARNGKIAVIQFHGVPEGEHPWVHTPLERFEEYMKYLHKHNYKVVALRDLAKYADYEQTVPDPKAIIETRKKTLERPNLLMIYTDDQTFRTLSCYRNEGAWSWVETPNIDRLATEGMKFTCAYGAAWCTPSRACFLTGKLPHGIQGVNIKSVTDGEYDPEACRFWPAELRKSGYETAMIGKWHLGHDCGHGRNWDYSLVWDQGDIRGDWYNDQLLSLNGAAKEKMPGYSTDLYTKHATDFIRRSHDKPWMLWLCYNAPHNPQTVAPRHAERYPNVEVPIPTDVFGPRPGKPNYMQTFTQWKHPKEGAGSVPVDNKGKPLTQIVREYNQLVCAVDEGVGQILKSLEDTGELDRTVVVFTSDQGFTWGDHGFAWKVGPYDACLKMPLLVRYPKLVRPGTVCHRPVTIVDLAPTLMGLAGATIPWETHGHDLQPLLANGEAEPDREAMMEFFRWEFGEQTASGLTEGRQLGGVPWWIFYRRGKYKYIRTLLSDEVEELYDLEADPAELNNLAITPAEQNRLAEYRTRFLNELKRTNAKLVSNLPAPKTLTP